MAAERAASRQNGEQPRAMEQRGTAGRAALADVSVEKTATGALIRLDARDGDVARVQEMAETMGSMVGADRPDARPPRH